MKKTLIALLVGLLLATTAACGGGGRPSVSDLSAALTAEDSVLGDSTLDDETANCFAEILHKSDVSDKTLQAVVDQDTDYEGSESDEVALRDVVTSVIEDCAPSVE